MDPTWAHDPWCHAHPASVNRQRGERGSAGPSRPRAALEQLGCLNGCAVSVESVSSRIGLRPDHRVTCLSERGSHSSVRDGGRGDGSTETYRRTPSETELRQVRRAAGQRVPARSQVVPGSALAGGVAGFRADRQLPQVCRLCPTRAVMRPLGKVNSQSHRSSRPAAGTGIRVPWRATRPVRQARPCVLLSAPGCPRYGCFRHCRRRPGPLCRTQLLTLRGIYTPRIHGMYTRHV